jgi:Legume lectin domain/Chitobiase/beta-hexosaminidase C-terminal domain
MKYPTTTALRSSAIKFVANCFRASDFFRRSTWAYLLPVLSISLTAIGAYAQINVLTGHNDTARTGQNLNETILTPADVNATQFGKLFQHSVGGWMLAQPLYVQQVAIAGKGTHNVVYVATNQDIVYAFDADTNGGANASPLWQVSLLTNSPAWKNLTFDSGVWGTPVINLAAKTMWLVSSEYQGTTPIFRLHALDITSGAEKFGGPIQITASLAGTGSGSVGGVLTFDPNFQKQRPGLLLQNGTVYAGFGSNNDEGAWHGWLFSFSVNQTTQTIQQLDFFCSTPNGTSGGIWMGGSGLAGEVNNPAKPYGRLFLATANGTFSLAQKPYSYGMSVLDFDLTGGKLTLEDTFSPFNAVALSSEDGDLGSGGPVLLPSQTLASGKILNPLIQIGKSGMFYILDRDNSTDGSNNPSTEFNPAGLGSFHAGADQIVQEVQTPITSGIQWGSGVWGTNAYWNNNIYSGGTNVSTANEYTGSGSHLTAWSFINGVLSRSSTSQSNESYFYPGPTPSVSANGNTDGIVWALSAYPQTTGKPLLVLLAYDATNLANTLYSSNTNVARDSPGSSEAYTVPTIANGKVYVGAKGQLDVYGLLNSPEAPAPVITPGSESFTGSLKVTITDAVPGATIYYTTDGSEPTTSSLVYPTSTGLVISTSETIKAIASATGYIVSDWTTANYVSTTVPSTPVLTLAAGTYIGPQTLTITESSPTATVYYTLDGANPVPGAADTHVFSQPISIAASETVTAIAVNPGPYSSPSVSAAYVIEPVGTIDFTNGFATANGPMQFNGSTDLDDFRLQLTNGGLNQAGSAFYATPVNVQAFTTNFTIQLSNPVGDGITFTIQNTGPTALGSYGNSLGYRHIGQSVAIKFDIATPVGNGDNSTGLYTDGAAPTLPAIDLTGTGIDLHSGDYFNVVLTYDGNTLNITITNAITLVTWSHSFILDIPAIVGGNTAYVGFTGGTGSNTSSQKISSWFYEPQPPPSSSATFALGAMTLNGGAAFNGSRLRLTDGGANEIRSAFLNKAVNIQHFTTTFGFQLTNPNADGFTFTIQGVGPTALGSSLGYQHILESVAIKFDLYNNSGEGPDSTGIYTNGAVPTIPATDLTPTQIDLHSGDPFTATLTYNGTILTAVITDTVTAATATQTYTVNIPSLVGASTAYVGFTAASGSQTATQEILNWTYTN